jgi:hypothetical protein
MVRIGLVSFWNSENSGRIFDLDNANYSTESSWILLKTLKKYFLTKGVLFDSYKNFNFNDIDLFLYRDLPIDNKLHRKIIKTNKPRFFMQNEIWHLRKENWQNLSFYNFNGVLTWFESEEKNTLLISSNPFLLPSIMSEKEFDFAKKLVMINSNRTSKNFSGYHVRKEWLSRLGKSIDLYGVGWGRFRFPEDDPFLRLLNSRRLNFLFKISPPGSYKGSLYSKSSIKNTYVTSLVIENFFEKNYVTEKIWDSFAMGAIPIYLGPPNVDKLLDKFYIDLNQYKDSKDLLNKIYDIKFKDYLNYFNIYLNFTKTNLFYNANNTSKKIYDYLMFSLINK